MIFRALLPCPEINSAIRISFILGAKLNICWDSRVINTFKLINITDLVLLIGCLFFSLQAETF
jgi:hypothetical protein